jgi:hypothetical protein
MDDAVGKGVFWAELDLIHIFRNTGNTTDFFNVQYSPFNFEG